MTENQSWKGTKDYKRRARGPVRVVVVVHFAGVWFWLEAGAERLTELVQVWTSLRVLSLCF
jgi:hypothetical protein